MAQERTFANLNAILESEISLRKVGSIKIPVLLSQGESPLYYPLHYTPIAMGVYSPSDGSYSVMIIIHDSLDNNFNSISRTGGPAAQIEFDFNSQIVQRNAELISLPEIKMLAPATAHLGYYSPLESIGHDVGGVVPFNSRTLNLRMGYYQGRSESLMIHELVKVLRAYDGVIRALPK